jgi:hypothetical protein
MKKAAFLPSQLVHLFFGHLLQRERPGSTYRTRTTGANPMRKLTLDIDPYDPIRPGPAGQQQSLMTAAGV